MDKTPIEFVPVQTWRIALQGIAKIALYLITIAVIIGPTLLMIAYSKPESAGCAPSKPIKLVIYPRQTT